MAIHDPDLLDAIESLGAEALDDVIVWRHMFNDNPPGLAAIYTSQERDTTIAEGQHAIDSQPLRPKARRYVYELRVSARKALRISEADYPALGLDPDDLESPDFTACQRIAAHATFLEYDALIVPSARADGSNLVIFVNELAADATFERVTVEQIE